jgi:hypothetical protein
MRIMIPPLMSPGGVAGAGSPRREGAGSPQGWRRGRDLSPGFIILATEPIKPIKKNRIPRRKTLYTAAAQYFMPHHLNGRVQEITKYY